MKRYAGLAALLIATWLLTPAVAQPQYFRGRVFPDGTSGAPSVSFASDTGSGFYRRAAGIVSYATGGGGSVDIVSGGLKVWSAAGYGWYSGALGSALDLNLVRSAAGRLEINNGSTIGSAIKVDALPTVGSGFGTTPTVTAGSTPFAGSVNVGTGGVATTGVITFGGTAFPSAPFCTYSTTTTNAVTRGTPTTTQLTLNSTTAWTASDVVSWVCVSSK